MCSPPPRAKLQESFRPPFSKGGAIQRAERWSRLARREIFLVASSFLPSFFLCASDAKEKSGHRIKLAFVGERGTPHLCGSPLPSHGLAFTPLWRFRTIRNFALCGGRPTLRALDRRKPLKRLDRNFLKLRAVAVKPPLNPNLPPIVRAELHYAEVFE